MRLLAAVIIQFFFLTASLSAAAAVVQPPVDGTVADRFRAPINKYAAGNRGWEYSVDGMQAVRAPVNGTVDFAGQVGGVLNLVIKSDDGYRFTLSKLASIDPSIKKGVHVDAGALVGVANQNLYFGVRCGDQYLDPALFMPGRVHLVADVVSSNQHNVLVTAHNEAGGSCKPLSVAEEQWLKAGVDAGTKTAAKMTPTVTTSSDGKNSSYMHQTVAVGGVAVGALVLRRSRRSRT